MSRKKFRYTARKVSCTGKQDGRGWRYSFWPFKENRPVLPPDDQVDRASFEIELHRAAEDDLADIAIVWSEKDKILKTKYCTALVDLENAANWNQKEFEDVAPAKKEYDQAEEEYEAIGLPMISSTAEWIFLGLMMIGEFYFNYLIFNILGVSRTETYIVAGTISFLLPVSAMLLGGYLKSDIKSTITKFFIVVLSFMPLLVFLGIYVLRAALFEGDWTGDQDAPPISPAMASGMFVFFNLFLFWVGVAVSYNAAHAKPELFRSVKMRLRKAKQRFEKENREFLNTVHRYENAKKILEQAKHRRKEEFDLMVAHAQDLIKKAKLYIAIYRDANIGARANGKTPACFLKEIQDIQIPLSLQPQSLDWSCKVDHNLLGANITNNN